MTPEPPTRSTVLGWLDEGTRLLHVAAAGPGDHQVLQASALPGWTNAHLLTHIARNADALANLVDWAVTGIETPMYPGGPQQRLDDIDAGARRTVVAIRHDLYISSTRLRTRLTGMTDGAWDRTVRTAQGRLLPATSIPWLRVREVWIHAVDLGTGVSFTDAPDDLADALLDDIVATYANKGTNAPAITVRTVPDGCTRSTRPPEPGEVQHEITGTRADLLAWLTGRDDGRKLHHTDTSLPALPAWL